MAARTAPTNSSMVARASPLRSTGRHDWTGIECSATDTASTSSSMLTFPSASQSPLHSSTAVAEGVGAVRVGVRLGLGVGTVDTVGVGDGSEDGVGLEVCVGVAERVGSAVPSGTLSKAPLSHLLSVLISIDRARQPSLICIRGAERRRGVDGGASRQQGMRPRVAAVVCQGTEHRIRNLVPSDASPHVPSLSTLNPHEEFSVTPTLQFSENPGTASGGLSARIELLAYNATGDAAPRDTAKFRAIVVKLIVKLKPPPLCRDHRLRRTLWH